MTEITETMLDSLREEIMGKLSPKRFRHTVAVEAMVARLCGVFCPENTMKMRAAGLLHDITKEKTLEEQVELCRKYGLSVSKQDLLAPKTFHARTGAAIIENEYPQFADEMIVCAVRWHTTGHANMTLTEKLLYLADYIDASRTYRTCVILRRYFWGAEPEKMTEAEKQRLLTDSLILSFDMTMQELLEADTPIASDTVDARNSLILLKADLEKAL